MTTKITDKNISNLANAGIQWQSVVVADGSTGLTAVAGRGYFIDTTSGTQTVTLPASPKVGDVVVLKDYARTWGTNNVTIASTTFDGFTNNPSFSTTGQTVTLVYMDNTKGWSLINEDTTTGLGQAFISATGGTVTTSGDFKIHTFTGDGCFVVSQVGNPAGSDTVDYLVVAGGGGGGSGPGPSDRGAGGGAGGFRESHSTPVSGCYAASPLATPTGIVVSTTYPITVGSGGSGAAPGNNKGINGNNSIFSTITSAGGGGGGAGGAPRVGNPGGSGGGGGGGGGGCAGGTGNTPPTNPPQGNNGGFGGGGPISSPNIESAGGGGAGAVGTNATPSAGGFGGDGVGTLINPATGVPGPGCSQYYAGGGGAPGNGGDEALGGGGISCTVNAAGDTNSGGGGAGAFVGSAVAAAAGGSGIVVIRYKFQ